MTAQRNVEVQLHEFCSSLIGAHNLSVSRFLLSIPKGEKSSVTYQIGGFVGTKAGVDGRKNKLSTARK